MSNPQIAALVVRFVSELEAVVRQQALASVHETLRAALGGSLKGDTVNNGLVAKRGPGRPPKSASKAPKKAAAAPKAASSGRVRRSTTELEQDAHRVLDYVRKNPGKRSEDIRASLKLDKAAWVRTVGRLVEKGQLKSQGEKRTTTYSVA